MKWYSLRPKIIVLFLGIFLSQYDYMGYAQVEI